MSTQTTTGTHTLDRGPLRIELAHIGEGYGGDYDPADESDEPLLRFTVLLRSDAIAADNDAYGIYPAGEYVQFRDGSACTNIPATITDQQVNRLLSLIARRVEDAQPDDLKDVFAAITFYDESSVPEGPVGLGEPKPAGHWGNARLDA